ncbi:V-type ATP synthase subunit F [Parasphaerochaeta coccoides]|uniref:Vacuolar H+transporting two-sector ATPase F subunit n=1 Tax=Parasphaerochaeta coccoides (strain ATCC BAA-1237 / DSM 17374 / SPN1) TaxID=760011 RepID=F4GH85_PARC1|nr:V-type ATP synthase subunit F [Parasphaerochaeta coccoides]AEC01984.1 Vacuolar H+transporting two-sector ATPase F subunit [Parasphaerochaeta coccoides DSM 17374]
MNYFVIGDEDTVLGFSLVGVAGLAATTPQEAKSVWDKALEDHLNAVIIITQDAADMIRTVVDRYLFSEAFPLVVEIPSPHGEGKSRDIRTLVNDAIGVSL